MLASIAELQTVTFPIREIPESEAAPVPIPEPCTELAVTCEFKTKTIPIDDEPALIDPYPVPTPEP
jgi:hypothetical protein